MFGCIFPILRTVGVRLVSISDVIEEVDFLLWEEEGDCQRVYWCVTPPLPKKKKSTLTVSVTTFLGRRLGYGFYLVVKSASPFQIIHISGVRFSPPELHIRNLHVTPDCLILAIDEFLKQGGIAHNDSRYTSNRRRPR